MFYPHRKINTSILTTYARMRRANTQYMYSNNSEAKKKKLRKKTQNQNTKEKKNWNQWKKERNKLTENGENGKISNENIANFIILFQTFIFDIIFTYFIQDISLSLSRSVCVFFILFCIKD